MGSPTLNKHAPIVAQAVQRYLERFHRAPAWLVRAPGRVNLIGEHTDYNDGFVLPMAIDRAVWIVGGPRGDREVAVESLDFSETARFSLAARSYETTGWLRYAAAVAQEMRAFHTPIRGWQGVVASDLPVGAGLSSSAALELGIARLFAAASDLPWDKVEMARLAQRAENRWVGVQCGIMDQLACSASEAAAALLIDCRSLAMLPVALPAKVTVVVIDTATRRELANSAYNARRRECEAAAALLGVASLRDATLELLDARAALLGSVLVRRARHVISEIERTRIAAEAIPNNPDEFGRLMDQSHHSLCRDFEVCRIEVELMTEAVRHQPGCLGARMTGGGFGGCVVALVEDQHAANAARQACENYEKATKIRPTAYLCRAVDGVELIPFRDEPQCHTA